MTVKIELNVHINPQAPVKEVPMVEEIPKPTAKVAEPRVAVVAVHGVSNIEPSSTVRMIGSLLLNLKSVTGASVATCYTPFEEVGIHVDVSSVPPTKQPTGASPPGAGDQHWFQTLKDEFTNYEKSLKDRQATAYPTIRLEGMRRDDATHVPSRTVDLYEMYWSDLSRLSRGLLSIFTAIYQLVFHSAELGLQTAQDARKYLLKSNWHAPVTVFTWIMTPATWGITTLLPILFIFLMMLVSVEVEAVLVGWCGVLSPLWAFLAFALFSLTVVGSLCGFRWMICLAIVEAAALIYLAGFIERGGEAYWIAHVIWGIGMCIPAWVASAALFRRRQKQVLATTIFALLCCSAALAYSAIAHKDAWQTSLHRNFRDKAGHVVESCMIKAIQEPAYQVMESVMVVTFWTWTAILFLVALIFLFTVVIWFVSEVLVWVRGPLSPAHKNNLVGTRSIATGFIGIAISCTSFYWVTLLLFLAVNAVLKQNTGDVQDYHPVWSEQLVDIPVTQPKNPKAMPQEACESEQPVGTPVTQMTVSLEEYAQDVLVTLFTERLLIIVIAQIVTVAVLVVVFLPSVVCDIIGVFDDRKTSTFPTNLGKWLSFGFGSIYFLVGSIYVFGPGLQFVANLDHLFDHHYSNGADPSSTRAIIDGFQGWIAGGIAGSAFGLFFASQWLEKNLRTPLGLILDVDNYLQDYPEGPTPRARMLTRYAGLLKYLRVRPDPNDPDRPYYSRIVIVAHSQGTVLSADMLKYLNLTTPDGTPALVFEGPTSTTNIDVRLLTFGSPLRQLYGWRFPVEYGWARTDLPTFNMRTKTLGLRLWINTYCSGDYIGRDLWRDRDCHSVWIPGQPAEGSADCFDICLGAGAHTHYWDGTIIYLAQILDQMICEDVVNTNAAQCKGCKSHVCIP